MKFYFSSLDVRNTSCLQVNQTKSFITMVRLNSILYDGGG